MTDPHATGSRAAMVEPVIRFGKIGSLWEVTCDWGVFQADDLQDALISCAYAYEETMPYGR